MKMKPLRVLDSAGNNRAPSTLKGIAKSKQVDRVQLLKTYLIERLGYTEARAESLLRNYS